MNCCKSIYYFDNIILGGKKQINENENEKKQINENSNKLEIDDMYYKNILIKYDENGEVLLKALDIVKEYIIREKLIIVGGMAIDFALRLKGSQLYSNDEIPDYDFITPHHWIDAYNIGQLLKNAGIKDLSIINAQHPTTMRVRILSTSVADSTYVPEKIFKEIPRLNYHGFEFVHPYYQYIDQHRSLANCWENIDMDRPVILNRGFKDMKRYDMLWEKYPLKWEEKEIPIIQLDNEKVLPLEIIEDQCISGFLAIQYWVKWASKYGFLTTWKTGNCEISKTGIIYTIPIDSHGVSIYSNDIKDLYNKICKKYKIKETRFYERYLDKIPRKIILENEWEILDNYNQWLAAHKIDKFYIANLQSIMLYMIINFILLNKMKGENRGYTFYAGYMICRELLKFGADNELVELLPTAEYYGKENYTESYLLMKYKFMNRNNPEEKINIPQQPKNLYDRDLNQDTMPEFNPSSSELFEMSGEQIKNFL